MTAQQIPTKSVVSVSEMASMCQLSRTRFYALMKVGVFPQPVRNAVNNRPIYDHELQTKCLEIRRTGIALNGQPVLFNKRRCKKVASRRTSKRVASTTDHSDLMESLKSLGMISGQEAIDAALCTVFPDGVDAVDPGEVIRSVFLHLQSKS